MDLEKKQLWPRALLEESLEFIDDDKYCRRLIESHLILYEKYEALQEEVEFDRGQR
jgi:hypothetical protein